MKRRFLFAAILFVAGASCAPPGRSNGGTTTTVAAAPHTPVISSFTVSTSSGPAPLTAALAWSISDPDGAALSCAIDLDGNNTTDISINPCTTANTRTRTFSTVGVQRVTLTVSNGTHAASSWLNVTVGAASAERFNIDIRFSGSLTTTQTAAFTSARTRWESIIGNGLPDQSINLSANFCGTGAPSYSGTVDDLLIDASIVSIDGPGGVLAQAGPCLARGGSGLPVYGVMKFDVADVATLETNGQLNLTILHEMGHVLGFGTTWTGSVLTGAGTSTPRFTGPAAIGAWNELGGGGTVPVENSGGAGTADSHWSETVFGNELMTGWLDTTDPLSRLTIASLADLGYSVDTAQADPYTRPSALRILAVRRPPVGAVVGVDVMAEI